MTPARKSGLPVSPFEMHVAQTNGGCKEKAAAKKAAGCVQPPNACVAFKVATRTDVEAQNYFFFFAFFFFAFFAFFAMA
jgi:hypothetical protein